MVAGYSLFKEGMYVGMDEYWYSIKKQIDGLNLGNMRHSFHSFVLFIFIFFRTAAFGGIPFLMFKEGSCESLGCWSITHPDALIGGFSMSGGDHCRTQRRMGNSTGS